MSYRSRRLISLTCLVAYLFATAPVGLSASCGPWASLCPSSEKSCLGNPGHWLTNATVGDDVVCASKCCCHCGADSANVTSTVAGQPSQQQGDDHSYPGSPACPGKCHLCSAGNVPFCFTPSVVTSSFDCLDRVSADTLLHLWQPQPDELIRPPMC